ncbi:MAG: FHA domain-containing protein [Fimbriiglobus sp.]|nr:FHA domain-containing protein [Fimbriiglobus sp.]
MSDLCFKSVHLEGLPRREDFRIARARLEASCGLQTLAGRLEELGSSDPGDGLTLPFDPSLGYQFFVQDGEKLHSLKVGVNSVGRLPDNTVVIRDECVSRRHCAIVVHRNGSCELHDVASKNGTILNGNRIHGPTVLRPGDKISLCARNIVFLVQEAEPAPPAKSVG